MPIYSEMTMTTQRFVPTTGGTINLPRNQFVYGLVDPAGTLATLTVNMPSNPQDNDLVILSSSQIITALTMGNGTLVGNLTALVLGGNASFLYNSETSKWFRVG